MNAGLLDKIIGVSSSFFETIAFGLTTYFVLFKKKKITLSDIFLFCTWLSLSISFFLIFIMLLGYHFLGFSLKTTYFFILVISIFWVAPPFSIFLFLLSKVPLNQFLKAFLVFVIGVTLFLILFFYFKHGKPATKMNDPYIESQFERVGVYGIIGIISVCFLLFLWAILEDFRQKKISWDNLSPLYTYFALFLFGIITFIRLFYFIPRPIIIEMFYFLIPYLTYLARKEELKHEKN